MNITRDKISVFTFTTISQVQRAGLQNNYNFIFNIREAIVGSLMSKPSFSPTQLSESQVHHRFSFLVLIVLGMVMLYFPNSAKGQNKELEALTRKKYVQTFSNRFIIWPVSNEKNASFIAQSSDLSRKLVFKPNYTYHLGVGAYIFGIGYQFTFALPQSNSDIRQHGKSKSPNFQISFRGKSWVFEPFISTDKGFYMIDKNKDLIRQSDVPRPDIKTRNIGASSVYYFQSEKFSMRAADNNYERQLKSAGSILLRGTINTFSLNADSAIYRQSYFGAAADFTHIRYLTFGLAPGYAHNFVIRKYFFLSASAAFGPALNLFKFSNGSSIWKSDSELNTFSDLRVGGGYNSERFFAGVSFIHQSTHINYDKTKFVNEIDVLKLAIGYRFYEAGVLKRRAMDFLKPKGR